MTNSYTTVPHSNRSERRRVVVTGLGAINPLAHDVTSTWQAIVDGRSGIGPITHFDASSFNTRFAGEVTGFDPVQELGRKLARRTARVTQLALVAAREALEDAALGKALDGERTGVLVGTAMGNLEVIINAQATLDERGPGRVSPYFVPMMLPDTPAAMISITYGLQAPVLSLATACATGNDAIGQGATLIRRGTADVMVVGGTDAAILPLVVAGYSNMGALSRRNDDPATASRPFDLTRDGFVIAEGAAILVLEALEHALGRGAKIYGELLGYGASADAHHISAPAESGEGAVRAIQTALAEARLEPHSIDYINAHGTSTRLNDKSETAAIKSALGQAAAGTPVSSTKSGHGHLLGAAGALEAIICLKAMEARLLPPTLHYEHPDPDCDLDYVPLQARSAAVNIAMSNSFGFGGHNAVIILGKL